MFKYQKKKKKKKNSGPAFKPVLHNYSLFVSDVKLNFPHFVTPSPLANGVTRNGGCG